MIRWAAYLVALLCLPPDLSAADIDVLRFAGKSQLRLQGTIQAGDASRLLELFRGTEPFAGAMQLDSPGGDVNEAMALGRLVRSAMLATNSIRACDGACFLIWVAGVERRARVPMSPGISHADGEEIVRAYLAEMEVPHEVAGLVVGSRNAGRLSPEVAVEMTGERSSEHQAWLALKCGALDEEERQNLAALEALVAMEGSMRTMGGSSAADTLDADTQRLASEARLISPEDRDALLAKDRELKSCQRDAINEARAELLNPG